jgi:hypothetical protein
MVFPFRLGWNCDTQELERQILTGQSRHPATARGGCLLLWLGLIEVDFFEAGVLEDEFFFAGGTLELDDGAGHGAGGGDFLDATEAELGVADEHAAAEFAGEGGGFAVLDGGFAEALAVVLGAAAVGGFIAVAEASGGGVFAGEVDFVEAFVGHFGEELGGDGAFGLAADHAVAGVGEEEVFHGAGDADKAEAAFLLHFIGVGGEADGAGVGDEAVFHADDGDEGEFEAFGGVEGHEGDGAAGVFEFVDVGDEGDLFEEAAEPPSGTLGPPPLPRVLEVVFGGDVEEFADVGEFAFAGVLGAGVDFFEVGFEAGFADDAVHKGTDGNWELGIGNWGGAGGGAAGEVSPSAKEGGEFLGAVGGAGEEVGDLAGLGAGFEEADVLGGGVVFDFEEAGFAEAAGGDVGDAVEGDFVEGVGDDAEVGEDVLDFLAGVELGAAGDLVGDAGFHEGVFEDAGEGVDAVEDGHFVPGDAVGVLLFDTADDFGGFLVFVAALDEGDLGAFLVFGPEVFLFALGVLGDEGGGGAEDDLGGAVVLLEEDDLGVGVELLEFEDVLDVGAAPAVDGLVGVAGGADVFVVHGEHVGEGELGVVGVLVLVDEDVLVAFLEEGADGLVVAEEDGGFEEKVVKIDSFVGGEDGFVAGVNAGDVFLEEAAGGLGEGGGGLEFVFGVGDGGEDGGGLEVVFGDVDVLDGLFDRFGLVGGVEDGEGFGEAGFGGEFAEEAGAQAVEGGDGDAAAHAVGFADEGEDTVAHFTGGLVGEGDGEDVGGGDATGDEVGDAAGDGAGFAGAGAGEDEEGAVDVDGGFALRGGEAFEDLDWIEHVHPCNGGQKEQYTMKGVVGS